MNLNTRQKNNKKLFFLLALPRSGNTLFASLMNQNKNIVVTANSITLEIFKKLFLLKETSVFKNFPDEKSLDNVLDSVFNNYYKDWPQKVIIDRGPIMLEGNFNLVKKHYKHPFKIIVILRDLMDVLASYMKWYTENQNAFPNTHGLKTDDEKLSLIMQKDGAVVKLLHAIQNSFKQPNICHFVKYDDLVTNVKYELKKIYDFIEEPYYEHRLFDLDQVNINGVLYNDSAVGNNMHKIKTKQIKKIYNPYIDKIPKRIKEKYGHIRF